MQFKVSCVLSVCLFLHMAPRYGPLNHLFHWARPATEAEESGSEGVDAGATAVNANGDEPRQENANVSGDAGDNASDA